MLSQTNFALLVTFHGQASIFSNSLRFRHAKHSREAGVDLSGMRSAPAWPPPPLKVTRRAAGAAMAVTTPNSTPSLSKSGPCSMWSSTNADMLLGWMYVSFSISYTSKTSNLGEPNYLVCTILSQAFEKVAMKERRAQQWRSSMTSAV